MHLHAAEMHFQDGWGIAKQISRQSDQTSQGYPDNDRWKKADDHVLASAEPAVPPPPPRCRPHPSRIPMALPQV
jgi:hypothetical protein